VIWVERERIRQIYGASFLAWSLRTDRLGFFHTETYKEKTLKGHFEVTTYLKHVGYV
jgi:hypothetical protein